MEWHPSRVTRTRNQGKEIQFELVGNSSYQTSSYYQVKMTKKWAKIQGKLDFINQVSGEFKISELELSGFYYIH